MHALNVLSRNSETMKMMKLKVNERLEPNKKKEAANSLKSPQLACIFAVFRNITSGFKDGKVSYSETPSDFSQAVANLLGLNNVSASELSSIDVVVNDLSKKTFITLQKLWKILACSLSHYCLLVEWIFIRNIYRHLLYIGYK